MATPAKKAFDEIMKAGKPTPSIIEAPTPAAPAPSPATPRTAEQILAETKAAAAPAPKPAEVAAPPTPKPPPVAKTAAPKQPPVPEVAAPSVSKRQKTKAALPTFPGVLPEPTPSFPRAAEEVFLPTSTAALSEQLIEAPSVVFAAETGRKKKEPPTLGPPKPYEAAAYARQRITELETLLQRPNNTYEQVEGFYKQLSDNYRTLGKKEESEFFKGMAKEVRDAPRLYTAPGVAEKPLGPLTEKEFKKQQLERNLPLDERALQAARTYEAPRPSVVVARPGLQEVSVLRDRPEMLLLREGAEDLASLGKSIFLGTSAVVTRVPYINSEGAERIAARAFKENADKNRKAAEDKQRAEWEKLEAAGVRDSEEARKLYEEVVRKEADEKSVFSNYVSRRTQDLLNLWEADKVQDPKVLKDMERRARLRARADLVYWSTVSGGRFVPGSVLAGDVARAPANLLGFTREDIEKSRAPSAAKNAAIGLLNAWESDTVRALLPQRRLMATGQVARAESVPGWLLNVGLGIPDYAVTAFVRATHEEDRKGFYQDFVKAMDERKDVVTWRLEQDPDLQADLQSGDIDRVLSGLGTLSPYISMLILTPSTAEVGIATARPLSKPILASANATGIGARFIGQTPLIARQIAAAPRADRLKVANTAIRDAASRAMQQQASVIAPEPRADALRAIDQYSKELARNGGDVEATLDSKRVDAATRKLLRDQIQLVLSQDADVQKFLELSGGSTKPPRAGLENAPILGAGTVSAADLAAAQRGQAKYAQAYLDAATEVSRQFLATPTTKPVAPPPAGGTPPPPPAPTGPVSTTPVPAAPTPPMAPSIPPAAAAPTPAAPTPAAPTPAAARVPADEARDLVAQIDAGGAVPAFISKNLERIARENGVQIRGDMTPTDVIEALRNKIEAEAPKAAPAATREQLTEAREKAEAAEKEFFAVRDSLVERAKRALATQTGEQARARLEAAYEAWADASNEYADLRGVGGPTEFPSIERGADVVQRQRMRQAEILLAELSGRGIATEWEQVPTQFRVDARRRLTKAQQNLANKKITEADFIEEVGRITEELTIKAEIERAKAARGRTRGADWVRSRLLAEKARGALDETGVDLADWFIQQNPRLADDLAISIRASEQGGVAGFYETLERLATLFKERGTELTATHEVLHHTERMLPEDLQKAIRKEWGARLKKQIKTASPEQRELLLSMLTGTDTARVQKAFEDGTLPGAYYQFSNPSEFWAVNASSIVAGRYEAFKGGLTTKAKRWLTEFAQKVKGLFGLSSDAPIIRGLDAVLKGDGTVVSQQMLAQGGLFRAVEPTRPLSPVSDTARNHYTYEGEPVYGRGYAIRPPMQFAVGKRAHLLYLALKREVEAIRKYLGSEVSEDFANRMANVDHVGSELPLYADGVTDAQFSKFRVRETPDSVPQTYDRKNKEPVEPVRPGAAEKLPVQRDWNPEVTWTKDGNDFWNWADSVAAAHPDLPRARSLNDYLSSLLPWSDPLAKPEDVDLIRLEDIVFVDDPELSKVVGEHSQPVGMSGAPRVAETGGFTAIVVGFKDGKPLVQPLQWRGGAIEPAGATPGRFSPVKEPVLANPETLLYKERGRSFGEAERRPLTDDEWKGIRAGEKSVGTKNGALSLRYKNTDRFIKLAPPTRPAPGDFNINPDAARNYFSDLDIESVRASIEGAARAEVPAPTRAEVPAPTRAEVPEEVVEAVLRNKDPEEVAQIGAPEDKPLEVPEEQISQLTEQLSVEPDAEAFGVPPEARATFDSDAVSQILPPSLRPVTPVDRRKRAIEWMRAFGTPVMEGVPPVRPSAFPPAGAVPTARPAAPAMPGVPPVRPAAPPPAAPPPAAPPPAAPPPVAAPTPPSPAPVPSLFPSIEVVGQDLASARRTLELAAKRSMLGSLGYTWRRLKDYVLPANESQFASLSEAWREVAEGFEGTMQGAAEDLAHAGINIDIATDAPNTYAMDVAKNFSPSVRAALRNKHAEPSALLGIATAYLRNIQYLAPADIKGLHRIVAEWALGEDGIEVLSQRLFEASGRLVEANSALTRARQDGDVQFSAALALQGAWYDEIGKASMRNLTWTREQAKDINGYLYGTLDPKDPNGSAAAARARRHIAGLLIPEAYRPPLRSVLDFLPQQPKGPAFEPVTSAFGTAGVRPTNLDIPDNVDEMRVRDAAVDELAALMEQFEALTESNVYIPRAVRNAFARAMDQVAQAARASDDSWKAGAGGAFAYYKQIVVLGAGPFPRSSQFTTDFYSEICNVNDAVGPLAAARVARRSMMAYLLGQPLVSLGTLMGDVLRSVLNGNTRRGQTARDFITATSWTREIDAMFTGDPAVIIDTPGFRGPASEVRKAAIGAGVFESFWARSLPDVALSVARVTYGNPVAKFARQVYEGFRQNLQDNSNLFATRRRLAVAYTLMESGVPLREAMRMTTDITGNFAGELHPIDQMYTQYAFPFWSYRKFAARRALKTISSGARWFRIRYKTAEQLSDIATWVMDGSDEFGFHPDGMSEEFDPEDMANLRDRLAAENPQMDRDSSEFGQLVENTAEELYLAGAPNAPRKAITRYQQMIARYRAIGEERGYAEARLAVDRDMQQTGAVPTDARVLFAYYAPNPSNDMLPLWADDRTAVALQEARTQKTMSWYRAFGAAPRADQVRLAMLPQDPVVGGLTDVAAISGIASSVAWLAYHSGAALVSSDQVEKFPAGSFSSDIFAQGIETPAIQLGMRLAGAPTEDQGPMYVPSSIGPFLRDLGLAERDVVDVRGADILQGPETLRGFKWSIPRSTTNVLYVLRPVGAPVFTLVTGATLAERMVGNPRYVGPQDFNDRFAALAEFSSGLRMYEFSPTAEALFAQKEVEKKVEKYVGLLPSEQRRPIQSDEQVIELDVRAFQNLPAEEQRRLVQIDVANLLAGRSESLRGTVALRAFLIQTGSSPEDVYAMNDATVRGVAKTRASDPDVQRAIAAPPVTR